MGFFSFFGQKKPEFEEHLYSTIYQKHHDFSEKVFQSIKQDSFPLIAFHFYETRRVIEKLLDERNITYQIVNSHDELQTCDLSSWQRYNALLFSSNILRSIRIRPQTGSKRAERVRILLFEHYPISTLDDKIRELKLTLPLEVELAAFFALDERWMKRIDPNGRMQKVLSALNVEEGEVMGEMVAKSIRSAQKKLEKTLIPIERECANIDEWFTRSQRR